MPNLFTPLPSAASGEVFTELLARPGVRIERIVSLGQVTPADAPMMQDADEWVVLLAGAAAVRLGEGEPVMLAPGEHLFIAAGVPHWVTFTDPAVPSVWLAVHIG